MISDARDLASSLLWPVRMRPTTRGVLLWCVVITAGGSSAAGCLPAAPVAEHMPGGDPAVVAACGATYSPGHVSIHRLTNDEYNNTVRDLLFTASRPGDGFPPTTAGFSGFTNDSDHLNVYDDLIAGYYDAAEALSKEVVTTKSAPGGAYARLVTCAPSSSGCAESTVRTLAGRAWRRPVTDAEAATLMNVFNASGDFDTGLGDVITALLVSPKFIFNYAAPPAAQSAGATFALDSYALASRLSYFLWQSMPDDELFAAAKADTLTQPDTLKAEVTRMLADDKAVAFVKVLRDEWAGLASLGSASASRPGLDDAVRLSMVGEVDAFLQDLVHNDRSVLSLVTGNYGFVNQTLADYYGVPFSGGDPTAFVRVDAPGMQRRGVVTSAAILTATAGDVLYTHPVKRGKWVTGRVMCTEPPPPPPNIPVVSFDPSDGGGTPRQKLEAHASGSACSGCHHVMDAVGLGLENFDPFGKWRDVYASSNAPVDPSGMLPDGKSFADPGQMYDDIAADQQTRACLAQQIASYALTRAMTSADDHCVMAAIGNASVTPDGTLSDLVTKIVSTNQFQMQTGEAP
jgi:hypothetical protein